MTSATAPPTVLVTGANRGIGLEFIRQYRDAGRRVIGTARRPGEAEELSRLADRVLALDVGDPDSLAAFDEALGDERIDLLVSNAGIFPREDGPRGDGSLSAFDGEAVLEAMRVNAVGPLRLLGRLAERLGDAARPGPAKVVHVSSQMGSIERAHAGPARGSFAYRASKAALDMLTVLAANELAERGVIVVALHPGWVRTRMGGEEAAIAPEESVASMRRVIDALDAGASRRAVAAACPATKPDAHAH